MKSHRKQKADNRHDQRPRHRAQNAKEPAVQEERPKNCAERTNQHHPFHSNVEDTGIEGECPTNSRQQDRCGSDEHGRDKSEEDVHPALSFSFRLVASRSNIMFSETLPATTTSTMTA